MTRPLILLTNDDGIESPGLAALIAALDPLGDLLIVAPRTQQSGAGRSLPSHHDGRLYRTPICVDGQTWVGYAANASPAQAVQHALLELSLERRPSLAVSGINYGANVGLDVTVSGTVGAALEAAIHGIPAMAISLQVEKEFHLSHSDTIDFKTAAYFAHFFVERWIGTTPPPDIDVLKIEVPLAATPESAWRITRLGRRSYYIPVPPQRERLEDEGHVDYTANADLSLYTDADTDIGALLQGLVSVTPLSLDMTSRVNLDDLRALLARRSDTE